MAAGISFRKLKMTGQADSPRISFWLIVILCLPTFVALLVVLTSTMRPNMSVYLLIPLAFVAPSCLLGAVIMAIQVRRSMPRQLFRGTCVVLLLALVAAAAAITIVCSVLISFQRASARIIQRSTAFIRARSREISHALSGRVAFVTGASQGIGRACALRLATAGAAVAVAARNQEKLNELVHEITAAGGTAAAFPLDVTDEEQVKVMIKAAAAQFGKIDILVNNAGITRDQLVMRMKRADWDAVLQTNLTSAYLCIQQVSISMVKQRWGRIINIASVFGQMGQAGQANYSASKAGLIGLTMAIARELGSRNITCNAVAPGFIETAMTEVLGEEFKQNAAKQIPLGRVGSPADVANAVAFLASDEASYITGHVLNVNGGMLMG